MTVNSSPLPIPGPREDGRQRKARRTREALAAAALELVLRRGPDEVTVAAIADRADVARRTFSRYFASKEEAALDFVREDGRRINALLRERPAAEPPLIAYRRAVGHWLTDRDTPASHHRPEIRALLARIDSDPSLFAAYQRIRVDAQEESVGIVAARLAVDPAHDPRPTVVVDAAAGVLTAAMRLWARHAPSGDHSRAVADLAALVERSYDALTEEAAAAADREALSARRK
ncbi:MULTISPECIES: TetR family transcriptional regulator [Streptomyces]|jgi:AcrR family transcriptional regulator|uniref:TetR family transcriptional regulator n=1 Tax=Streptomyces TaxID=1883 RepID=UPI0019047599|nr:MULTISPECIES: TetR family transcriptional regulator [unclassified Streptomyces]MCU4745909.1 TetR family transcriptional regulator [Streptomyces sp. G-5]QQN76245.1 TetR family transcriptional regulator [Streptomyces sp. XC 2026]